MLQTSGTDEVRASTGAELDLPRFTCTDGAVEGRKSGL